MRFFLFYNVYLIEQLFMEIDISIYCLKKPKNIEKGINEKVLVHSLIY